MIYRVRARFREASAQEFRRKLTDGTIAGQKPDGQEMVDSMHRAVVSDAGTIEWSEVCYCPSPLAHERQTVLDHYFDDITTEPIESYEAHAGRPFLDYLSELADRPTTSQPSRPDGKPRDVNTR